MNVLFIYSVKDARNPAKPLKNQQWIHFGISYISSLLNAHQHRTELLVLTHRTPRSLIDDTLTKFSPKVICFTAVTSEYDFIQEIAHYIKSKYLSIYLLAGGTHVSLTPEKVISDAFDALCIGEGEYPTLELVQRLEKGKKTTGIQNLWIKHEGEVEENPPRPFYQDLDQLPFPDRKVWQNWIDGSHTKHEIVLGRGCPFQCTYCCNHALRKIAGGKYVRLRSPENVMQELAELLRQFPQTRKVYFEVETIGANIDFANALCAQLQTFNATRSQPLAFGVNLRITPRQDYHALFQAMKAANFKYLKIGVESGSERVRKNILLREYSNADIITTIQLARQSGLKVYTSAMVGIPGETVADFQETIACLRACHPDRINLSIFSPYPGTELYNVCQAKGFLTHNGQNSYERRIATLELPGFSRKEIQKQYDWFPYHFYKGRKSLLGILQQVSSRRLFSTYNIVMAPIFAFLSELSKLRNSSYRVFGKRSLF